ncbi:MAG TPA: PIN domain-containing protein, partial [Nitrososphaera sp.]|nr:PIN domain-containing protein [Nitrososphaera sp.]
MQKFHLFIDTNAFLSFFAYTKDDVEELRKLTSLIKTEQLELYLTQQVRDEFYRNREKKLHDSIAQFERNTESVAGVPRFMADYPQITDYNKFLKNLRKAKDEALQRAKKEAGQAKLAADSLFRELLKAAGLIRITKADYAAATRRMRTGNPPGKESSLGDRINWEILLRVVPKGSELHIVSKDGDYVSALDSSAPNGFLQDEWAKKKGAILFLHTELKPFLAEHFPKIKLAVDVEKRAAIDRLKLSGTFAATHVAIGELGPFTDTLTLDEIEELVEAAQMNSQIAWISTDEDVRQFYEPLPESLHDNRRLKKAEF